MNTFENLVSSTQWLLGRPIQTVKSYTGYDTAFTRTVTRSFNSTNNNIAYEINLPGLPLEIKHGYKYNTNGTLQRDSLLSGSVWRSTVYKYQLNDGIRLTSIIDPLLHIKTFTYYSNGRLYEEKDFLNNSTTFRYDSLGRVIKKVSSLGAQVTTLYSWESPTGTPSLARYSIQNTGIDGSLEKKWFDKLGRIIRSDITGFNGEIVYTSTEYNSKGQVYRISEPSSTTLWNTYSFDSYGRSSSITRPTGRNSTWYYAGANVSETTGGKTQSRTYNSAGLLITATDNGGSINYQYLPNGKIATITAPGNIITRIKYDYANNQTKIIDPNAGTLDYTYNAFGELTRQQNNRNQITTFSYYNDGRIKQKIAPEATADYKYDPVTRMLIRIKLSNGINRIFGYDSKGRMITNSDSIDATTYSTNFTFDTKGRLSTIKHPSGIIETRNYNDHGYYYSVLAGGRVRLSINGLTNRFQVASGNIGSMTFTNEYDNFGYLTRAYSTGGSILRDYRYSFNTVTGNLSGRRNAIQGNIQEDFYYDNLDRLDYVNKSGVTVLDMSYESSKGGIATKTDIGTFNYNIPNRPYAVSSINPATGLITDAMNDTLTFTSFERVNTISEGTHSAQIKYNCDNQRIKMILQQSGSTILTRLYIGESYMKEISIGGEKQYSYIGGDAYSAPAVAITQNGITKYYYLLRDHLGSITHIIDSLNSVIAEYSYDAWGRMRNPATLDCFSPNTEPTLLTGRGFTGHEHMPWFKTINMNGRLYDPLSGQFLSVDNFIQTPTFSQSFNRFGYCMNNPLKYNDPSGNYSVPSPKFFGDDNGSGSDGYDLDNDLYGNPIVDIGLNSGSSSAINTGNIDAIINALMSSNYGGFWSESNGGFYYTSDLQAYIGGSIYKSKYSGERRANTNRLELSSGNVDYSLTADLEGAGQPSEGAYYPNGIIFSQAVEHARYGGGTEISMPLSAVDLSKVKVSDFAGEGKVLDVDLGFGGKYKTNWNDALVHGTISLQLIKDNIVRIAPGSDTRFNCDVGAKNNHPWFGPNHQFKRNTLTVLLDFYLSDNRVYGYKPFNINYLGTATISYD